jgi:serine/threonine-protein kinase
MAETAQPLPDVPGYEFRKKLGQGGMGVVYEAVRLADRQLVALKMIVGARPEHVLRFRREVQAVTKLKHPNIVKLHDSGEHQGLPYFTMELVEGGSLAGQRASFPQPLRQAAAMVELLANAIHYAHQQGVIHRDLTPGNVLLTSAGQPKISDFGLAKCLDEDGELTSTGHIMGTPAYMAPEVAWGKTKEAGPAVDIYALGGVLYLLLTGQPPFRGTPAEIIDQARFEPPRRLTFLRPGIPLAVEEICLKCLAKKPHQRYETAAALAHDLRRLQGDDPIWSEPISSQTTQEWHPRPPPGEDSRRGTASWSSNPDVGGSGSLAPPNYELLEEVGRGGLAVVYKARQINLGRIVALRLPHRAYGRDQMTDARFRIEATVLSRLQHPNIVQIFDFGEYETCPYLALEFLDGGTLAQRLAGRPHPEGDSAQLVQTLARAMHVAHQQHFVHRNLKPHVVMFANSDVPKIINFAAVCASALGTDDLDREETIVGTPSVGTPSYMAPEQVSGQAQKIGPSVDVYGLGAILYAMLTGRPPFQANSAFDVLRKVMTEAPARPRTLNPRVGRRLEAICLKALEKDPAHRQASAAELADDLNRYLTSWFG